VALSCGTSESHPLSGCGTHPPLWSTCAGTHWMSVLLSLSAGDRILDVGSHRNIPQYDFDMNDHLESFSGHGRLRFHKFRTEC
jgi:hypothetical protein